MSASFLRELVATYCQRLLLTNTREVPVATPSTFALP